MGNPFTRHALATSHHDSELIAPLWGKPKAVHGHGLEEGVGGASVQQGEESLALDHHQKQQRVVIPARACTETTRV